MFFPSNVENEAVILKQVSSAKRRGLRLFNAHKNHQSSHSPDINDSPEKLYGKKVSLSEYDSALKSQLKSNEDQSRIKHLSINELPNSSDSEIDIAENNDAVSSLKNELTQKEEEIKRLQNELQSSHNSNFGKSVGINKEMFDRLYYKEKQRENANGLDLQLKEQEERKRILIVEKEKEKQELINIIQKMNEDKSKEHEEQVRKLKNYRAELDMQKAYRLDLKYNDTYNNKPERKFESFPEMFVDSPNAGYFSTLSKYTRKSPRHLEFNPITGVLKEAVVSNSPGANQGSPNENHGKTQRGSIPRGVANNNIFHSRQSDYFLDEKNRHLSDYGTLIMQSK
jgi:hypothetical protein